MPVRLRDYHLRSGPIHSQAVDAVLRLPHPRNDWRSEPLPRNERHLDVRDLDQYVVPLHQPSRSIVCRLWSSWHLGRATMEGVRELPGRYGRSSQGPDLGPDRQCRELRTGQLPLGNVGGAGRKPPATHAFVGALALALLLAPVATPRSAQNAQLKDGRVAPALSSARTGAPLHQAARGRLGGTSSGAPLTGLATWYDAPTPQDAAAGPRLRQALGSYWRGMTVRVCAGSRCVTATLSDWCLCGHGRVIDLDRRAFARLAPLSAGVIPVRVQLGAPVPTAPRPTAPATDQ